MLRSAVLTRGIAVLASQEAALHSGDRAEDLVARIRAGDPYAEQRVIELFGRPVTILLDRQTNGRPEAEDLFQDTFRIALEKLRRGELREPAKLPGFLAQIARSLAIEHYRKASRRRTEPDSEAVDAVPARGEGPLAHLLEHENAALVRRVIQELGNVRDRQILLRYYIAEEDKDRISADLGLDSLQFNRVLHRARQRYKELYLERLGARGAAQAMLLLLGIGILGLVVPLWNEGVRRAGN